MGKTNNLKLNQKSIDVILTTHIMSNEVLNTVFAQAEEILNNRSNNQVFWQPHDTRVLQTSDILLSSSRNVSPTVSSLSAFFYRNSWRQSQYLDDCSSQNGSDYLPELQGRQKWRVERNNLNIGKLTENLVTIVIISDNS